MAGGIYGFWTAAARWSAAVPKDISVFVMASDFTSPSDSACSLVTSSAQATAGITMKSVPKRAGVNPYILIRKRNARE